MRRRDFLGAALGTAVIQASTTASAFAYGQQSSATPLPSSTTVGRPSSILHTPWSVGLLIQTVHGPEAAISRVKQLGMSNCFLSLDAYIGKYTPALAEEFSGLLNKYGIIATAAEVVGPGPLVWDFLNGPSTIGLVPRATRAARIDALKQTSDFAMLLGIPRIQTHCGFIPENPKDPLYEEAVLAIREVAKHCAANGQDFLMETGQETPTTMSRAITDVDQPNLGVGLDTANLILYGKANPVDAAGIIGGHVKSIHAKDGKWPTDPMNLGEEVLIGTGDVDFEKVFAILRDFGYAGAVTIERETQGPRQIEDVKKEKFYLERILDPFGVGRVSQIHNSNA
ncbi:MAG: sugar phosphate isomerase/epimerase family protein [Acidobacteriaceae bacterium]